MKIFEWLTRTLYWLQAFSAPLLLFRAISIIIYSRTENKILALILLSIGVLSGIFLAEFIRRRYSLEKFFATIYGSTPLKKESTE